jgi:ATP-dependent Clp protease ATP-binding subunit ClpA
MFHQTLNLMAKPMNPAGSVKTANTQRLVALHPDRKGTQATQFEAELGTRVVGQERAVRKLASFYQIFHAGLTDPARPIGTMLFLGPTGSGKTHVVEAAAEVLFGNRNAVIKIDCGEFQHSHEIAKLIGSPPGYLGHRETSALLTQENLDRYRTEQNPFTLVLFDEIEKASEALWQLLLGVLDKGTLTLGDNRKVDFTQTMIFMTSNLGSHEMSQMISGSIGFAPTAGARMPADDLDQKIYHTALEAARHKFSPEFMNRIDKVVVFRSLAHEQLRRILDLELQQVQRRIDEGLSTPFRIIVTELAAEFLLKEGVDTRYGARHLKRSLERFVVMPLANLAATRQVGFGDVVLIDFEEDEGELVFYRVDSETAPSALEMARARQADHRYSLAA